MLMAIKASLVIIAWKNIRLNFAIIKEVYSSLNTAIQVKKNDASATVSLKSIAYYF